jgi:hypothetical protein
MMKAVAHRLAETLAAVGVRRVYGIQPPHPLDAFMV